MFIYLRLWPKFPSSFIYIIGSFRVFDSGLKKRNFHFAILHLLWVKLTLLWAKIILSFFSVSFTDFLTTKSITEFHIHWIFDGCSEFFILFWRYLNFVPLCFYLAENLLSFEVMHPYFFVVWFNLIYIMLFRFLLPTLIIFISFFAHFQSLRFHFNFILLSFYFIFFTCIIRDWRRSINWFKRRRNIFILKKHKALIYFAVPRVQLNCTDIC